MTQTDPDRNDYDELSPRVRELERGLAPVGRVIGYLILWWIAVAIASSFVLPFVLDLGPADLKFLSATAVPNAIATVLVTLGFVRYIDRRPMGTLGLCREGSWLRELGFGMLLGVILVGLVFLGALALGWTRITGSLFLMSSARTAVIIVETLVVMAGIAIAEEVAIRGYVLQGLTNGYGSAVGLIASSSLFGLLHLANPGAGLTAIAGTLVAGLTLGYAYLATRRLWLPIGLHFGWNFALGPIFGFPVSGIGIPGWVMHDTSGPVLWTGGAFGPEAGLLGLAALVLGVLAIRWFRSHWYRPTEPVLEMASVPAEYDEEDDSRAA